MFNKYKTLILIGQSKTNRDNIENSIKSYYQNSFAQQTRNFCLFAQQVKLDDRTQKAYNKQ